MKVLFVCRRNNGRSQLAKGLCSKVAGIDADSAGIEVDSPGQLLRERALQPTSQVKYIIQVMDEVGVDVREYARTSVENHDLSQYDKVVLLFEANKVPQDLAKLPNAEVWNIDDPQGKGLEAACRTRNLLEALIGELALSV